MSTINPVLLQLLLQRQQQQAAAKAAAPADSSSSGYEGLAVFGVFCVCVIIVVYIYYSTRVVYAAKGNPVMVGSAPTQRTCATGAYVNEIYGSADSKDGLYAFGVKCSDGVDLGSLGDSTKGTAFDNTNGSGYSALIGHYTSTGVNSLQLKTAKGSALQPSSTSSSIGASNGDLYTLNCPTGTRMVGYQIGSDSKAIQSIGTVCQ